MEVFPGISMDPAVRFGKPCLVGTRVDVATVVADLAAGESIESVEAEYQLTREQVLNALRYAAHIAAHLPPAVAAQWSSSWTRTAHWRSTAACAEPV